MALLHRKTSLYWPRPSFFLAGFSYHSFPEVISLRISWVGRARLAEFRHHYQEARQLGEESLQMLEKLKHVRVPEIRAWLEALPKSRFQALRKVRKRHQ